MSTFDLIMNAERPSDLPIGAHEAIVDPREHDTVITGTIVIANAGGIAFAPDGETGFITFNSLAAFQRAVDEA